MTPRTRPLLSSTATLVTIACVTTLSRPVATALGMVLTAVGVVLGLVLAWAASRSLAALLFELAPLDPVTYGGVVVLLLGVSAVACWGPAWRAARLDPAITLRAE